MALTGKKRLFADAVLAGKSNKDAAIAAGYSAATASQAGSRLARDKEVVAYLAIKRPPVSAGSEPGNQPAATETASERQPFDLATILLHKDPKEFLIAAMNDPALEPKLRVDSAKALMPFVHKKLGETGKKESKDDAARKVAGRFTAGTPPKLVAAGGKKV